MSPITPETPEAGLQSVWDYPRPPRCEVTRQHIKVVLGGVTIADTRRAVRVLETGHPPVYYIPPADIAMDHLEPSPRRTFCEWKGKADYYTVHAGGKTAENAAFSPIRIRSRASSASWTTSPSMPGPWIPSPWTARK